MRQRVPLVVPFPDEVVDEELRSWAMSSRSDGRGGTRVTLTNFIFLRFEGEELPPEVMQFISDNREQGRPIVAISFSSMPVDQASILQVAVDICEKRARAIDPNFATRRPSVIALIDCPAERAPALCEAGQGDKVRKLMRDRRLLITSSLPFNKLFPEIDAAILHGGAGATSEAFVAGIPVITSGILLMDQRYWARRIHETGVGPQAIPFADIVERRGRFIEDVVADALDMSGRPNTWRARARQVQGLLGAGDGVRENAEVVMRYGTATGEERPVVKDAYRRERCRMACLCRQFWCCVVALVGMVRCFISLLMQLPRCFLRTCWQACCCRCVCCRWLCSACGYVLCCFCLCPERLRRPEDHDLEAAGASSCSVAINARAVPLITASGDPGGGIAGARAPSGGA